MSAGSFQWKRLKNKKTRFLLINKSSYITCVFTNIKQKVLLRAGFYRIKSRPSLSSERGIWCGFERHTCRQISTIIHIFLFISYWREGFDTCLKQYNICVWREKTKLSSVAPALSRFMFTITGLLFYTRTEFTVETLPLWPLYLKQWEIWAVFQRVFLKGQLTFLAD